jgi:hypothetical protein
LHMPVYLFGLLRQYKAKVLFPEARLDDEAQIENFC